MSIKPSSLYEWTKYPSTILKPHLILEFEDVLSTQNRYGENEFNTKLIKAIFEASNHIYKSQIKDNSKSFILFTSLEGLEKMHEIIKIGFRNFNCCK